MDDENTLYLYRRDGGVLCYDVPGGYMTVPPHIRTDKEAVEFFSGRKVEFIDNPHCDNVPEAMRLAAEARQREMRELVAMQRAEERRRLKAEKRERGVDMRSREARHR